MDRNDLERAEWPLPGVESRLKELGFEWNVDFNNIEGAVRGVYVAGAHEVRINHPNELDAAPGRAA